MAKQTQANGIVARALAYPYANPGRSFVQLGTRTMELPPGGADLRDRTAVLAFGSNAAPSALAGKLAPLADLPLPLIRAELEGFDVVYSAHISPYGAIPATLQRSPGTVVAVFVAYPTPEQLRLLSATEPNYELRRLEGVRCRRADGDEPAWVDAYLSRHGCLRVGQSEVSVAAIAARHRRFPALDQAEVQRAVRDLLAPGMELERFIAGCLDLDLTRRRTAALAATANPARLRPPRSA